MKRNQLISFLHAWGIILVVLGHSDLAAPTTPFLHTWIYSFHMPLFMFISGFLLRYGSQQHQLSLPQTLYHQNFMLRKFKRLIIPYLCISSIAFVPKVFLSRFAMRPVDFSLTQYVHMLLFPEDNVIKFFWFLPTLFLIFSILYVGGGIFERLRIPAWLLLLAALLLQLFNPLRNILIFNISGVVNYLFYFLLGYFACRAKLVRLFEAQPWGCFCITLLLSVGLLFIPDFVSLPTIRAVNGIALSIALGVLYLRYNCTLINHLFGASYTIYLFSWFPQVLSQQVFLAVTHAPWWTSSILAFFSGLYIPLLIYRWILKHRESPFGKTMAFISGM